MRVAVVAMETSQYRDTAGRQRIERVAAELVAAGHEVAVFCSQYWDARNTGLRLTHENITYHAVTVEPTALSFCVRLPALLANYRPDVVHTIPEPPSVVLAAELGATLARAPLVVEWYGDEEIEPSRRADAAMRAPDQCVTPSELIERTLWEAGAANDRTTVIPESIDMERIREAEPAEEVDVVYAHRLDDSANIQSLFLGLAELRQRGWSATVIGDGPERRTYEQAAADLRIDDRVNFVGACDLSERISIYKAAHVFVQTAFREYFATDLLWALASGCIGIVEYQAESSAHELVEQRDRAFRVSTPQEIADKIVEAAEMERLVIDESLAEFDHDAVRERYEALYERLLDDHGLV